jgi:hypothetical protein
MRQGQKLANVIERYRRLATSTDNPYRRGKEILRRGSRPMLSKLVRLESLQMQFNNMLGFPHYSIDVLKFEVFRERAQSIARRKHDRVDANHRSRTTRLEEWA